MTIRLASLDALPRNDVHRALEAVLAGLTDVNVGYLRRHRLPELYRSGVRYFDDNTDADAWVDAPTAYARGYGHCADLSAWRAAELRLAGNRRARPIIVEYDGPETIVYHAVVQVSAFRTEDVSHILGMRY